MIKSFKHSALAELFLTRRTGKIDAKMPKRIMIRLDALENATTLDELRMPGYDFHALNGFDPIRYTIHVNGPWCITFKFSGGEARRVDFEQCH